MPNYVVLYRFTDGGAKAPLVNKVSNFHPVVDSMTAHEAGRAAAAEVCLDLADVG